MVNQESLLEQLTTILDAGAPPFVFIHEPPSGARSSASARTVAAALASVSGTTVNSGCATMTEADMGQELPNASQVGCQNIACAMTDCAAAFTPRLLFDGILAVLGELENTCRSVKEKLVGQKMDSLDAFVHALDSTFTEPQSEHGDEIGGARRVDSLVLVFEHAEQLRDTLPGLIYPLARMFELVRAGNVMTVFVSELDWEHVTPVPGTLTDPYLITIDPPSKSETIASILATFPSSSSITSSTSSSPSMDIVSPYNPVLRSLFAHFAETVYDICAPFVPAAEHERELSYIVAARWPGFVKPVLQEWRDRMEMQQQKVAQRADDEGHEDDEEAIEDMLDEEMKDSTSSFAPPTEDVRIRMLRAAGSSLAGAVEKLYPRLAGADEVWGSSNSASSSAFLSLDQPATNSRISTSHQPSPFNLKTKSVTSIGTGEDAPLSLPRAAAFTLLAAYLASHNPARTDARMFSRSFGRDGRGRKKGGGTRKTRVGGGKAAKLPQRLLGPTTFTYDRLIAILGALLAEYDDDGALGSLNDEIHDDLLGGGRGALKAEVDVYRVHTAASIQELVALRLLHRTSATDKLDAPGFRCALIHAQALRLARRLSVPLGELLWEPN